MSPESEGTSPTVANAAVGEVLVALAVVGLGLFTIVDAGRIKIPLSSNVVGPRVFPYAVGVALTIAGAVIALDILRGGRATPEEGEDVDVDAPTDWPTLAKLLTGFALHILLVDTLGWALAGALLFTVVAWALGGNPVKAAVIGVVLGFGVQAAFVSGLGVTLPAGLFENVGLLRG